MLSQEIRLSYVMGVFWIELDACFGDGNYAVVHTGYLSNGCLIKGELSKINQKQHTTGICDPQLVSDIPECIGVVRTT